MPGLLGAEAVMLDLQQAQLFGKVVTSGVMKTRSSTDVLTSVDWGNIYVAPIDETTAVGRGGTPDQETMITLWRIGETVKPRADYQIIVGGDTYMLTGVNARVNADEANNFAIYDCTAITTPNG